MNNLVIEKEKLIKNDLRDHDTLEAHKTKIDMLKEERTNLLEKIRFLESKHHSLLKIMIICFVLSGQLKGTIHIRFVLRLKKSSYIRREIDLFFLNSLINI